MEAGLPLQVQSIIFRSCGGEAGEAVCDRRGLSLNRTDFTGAEAGGPSAQLVLTRLRGVVCDSEGPGDRLECPNRPPPLVPSLGDAERRLLRDLGAGVISGTKELGEDPSSLASGVGGPLSWGDLAGDPPWLPCRLGPLLRVNEVGGTRARLFRGSPSSDLRWLKICSSNTSSNQSHNLDQ